MTIMPPRSRWRLAMVGLATKFMTVISAKSSKGEMPKAPPATAADLRAQTVPVARQPVLAPVHLLVVACDAVVFVQQLSARRG